MKRTDAVLRGSIRGEGGHLKEPLILDDFVERRRCADDRLGVIVVVDSIGRGRQSPRKHFGSNGKKLLYAGTTSLIKFLLLHQIAILGLDGQKLVVPGLLSNSVVGACCKKGGWQIK